MHMQTFLKDFERLYTIIPSEFHGPESLVSGSLKLPSLSHCPSCGHVGDEEDDETPWYGDDGPSDFFVQKPAIDIAFFNPVTITHFFPFLKSKDVPEDTNAYYDSGNKFKFFTEELPLYIKRTTLPKQFSIMMNHLKTNHNRFVYTIERYEVYKHIMQVFARSLFFDKTFSLEDKSLDAYEYWKRYEPNHEEALYNLQASFCTDCLDDIYIVPTRSSANIFSTLGSVPEVIIQTQLIPIYTYTALNLAFTFAFASLSSPTIPHTFNPILKPHTTL